MREKVIREDFGYECRYYPTIMDGRVFRWTHSNGIEVNASRSGVGINGNCTMRSLTEFLAVLQVAERTHKQLYEWRCINDSKSGGIWFGSEFWPWAWVSEGKP